MRNLEKKYSDMFYRLRGLAIISVFCAHCNIQVDGRFIPYIKSILSNAGSIGVGLFFLISGFFFSTYQVSIVDFLKKTVTKFIIPWVVASTCVWLYIVLRKGGISIQGWAAYILGYQSIYYYMTDLLIIQLIFYILEKLKIADTLPITILFIIINVTFIVFESYKIQLFPTPYLDFLCFIGYFAVGKYMQRHSDFIFNQIEHLSTNKVSILIVLVSVFLIFSTAEFTYFKNGLTMVFELIFILSAAIIAVNSNSLILKEAGKNSLFIYLWHLPLAGIISNIGSKNIITAYTGVLWPLILLCIMILMINIIKKFNVPDCFCTVIGFKK